MSAKLCRSVDLTRSADELWRQTASGHRSEINRGLRAGHRTFFDEGLAYLATCAELYRGTMERLGAAEHYFFSDAYFTALRDALGPRLRLCLVEVDGEFAAGGLFVVGTSRIPNLDPPAGELPGRKGGISSFLGPGTELRRGRRALFIWSTS